MTGTRRRNATIAIGSLLVVILLGGLIVTPATSHFRERIGHILQHAKRHFVPVKGTLPPGVTITGALGGKSSGSAVWEQVVGFPAPSRKALADADINFPESESKAPVLKQNDGCSGTPARPTAPPGTVCIYVSEYGSGQTLGVDARALPGARKRGFVVKASGDVGLMGLLGTWAYTEPRG